MKPGTRAYCAMIVNDKYRFVFIHIPKTAGTSIAASLKTLEGTNRCAVRHKHEKYEDFIRKYFFRTGRRASKIDDYLFFAFVRNPWTRFASLHRYLLEKHRNKYPLVSPDLNTFVSDIRKRPDWATGIKSLWRQTLFIRGCDAWIGRYETLQESYGLLQDRLGVSLKLKHLNHSSNYGRDHRLLYTKESIDTIAEMYHDDIVHFGYTYES